MPIKRKSLGSAVLADLALGTAAGVTAGSDQVIQTVCLNCGCQWIPGTSQERRLRALSGQLGDPARSEAETQVRAEKQRAKEKEERDLIWGAIGCGGCLLWLLIASLSSCSAMAASVLAR